ncbi:ArsR/SmtB family transcription factor [Apilactobacillus kunkeei]|uniref:ArsR/SmtB family transcription factor n=1 Tax=Apilactobacillus kunkeei TaxID=148814 RepID=UPI00112B1248|nr:metalloregulator ArsR/SmtB family transcription factor [Apilactobacillus kunkeei]TPR54168.1 ArsR family transcriptional regulator [Apilactobacillus kunkeei]
MQYKKQIIKEVASIYKVLSNERRIIIITVLMEDNKPLSVNEICQQTQLSQPVVSKQLGILYKYQIVCKEKVGTSVMYGVDDPHVVEMISDMIQHVKHEIVGKPHPRNLF